MNDLTIMNKTQRDIHHLAINKNDKELKEFIDSLCFVTFSSPNLLMCVFILAEHQHYYDIIKHVDEDCVHTIYVDPQKYSVYN